MYMWKTYQSGRFDMYPGHADVFKHIHQMLQFTDNVVMKCIDDAADSAATANWVPEALREWLIIEFKVGSHTKDVADQWIRQHNGDLMAMDPTQFGAFIQLVKINIYSFN